jgi:hypothetical protein
MPPIRTYAPELAILVSLMFMVIFFVVSVTVDFSKVL